MSTLEHSEVVKQELLTMRLGGDSHQELATQDEPSAGALRDTCADDKRLFDLALEVGLEDPYHSVMIPASSALHGDWAALEDLVPDRCILALHDPSCDPASRLRTAID